MEFATGCKDHSVRLWRILYNEEESLSVELVWGSNDGRLCASDLRFKGAIGLSPTYQKLLLQRGAVDDSLPSEKTCVGVEVNVDVDVGEGKGPEKLEE
jgi:hypothetical protein